MWKHLKNWLRKLFWKLPWLLLVGLIWLYEEEIRSYLKPDLRETSSQAMKILVVILENSIWIPWALVPTTIIILLLLAYNESRKEYKGKKYENISMSFKRKRKYLIFSIACLFLFVAILSYIWGNPVKGPFAGLTHPKASDEFRFHAGITSILSLHDLSRGIDFSKIMHIPNNPIELTVSRTWWSGWEYDLKLRSIQNNIEINRKNKKHSIRNLPFGWDYNSDDYAIEIVDANRNPIFQLIQDLDYDIYLNAIIISSGTVTIIKGNKLMINAPKSRLSTDGLDVIFKYPTYINRGVRL
jgi:hypothetical protein